MPKRYKILLRFTGTAGIELDGDSIEAVRRKISEIELADIARVGHADILSFEVAAREITQVTAPGSHEDDDESQDRPRPSGWSL
jgi:hypothetical protein